MSVLYSSETLNALTLSNVLTLPPTSSAVPPPGSISYNSSSGSISVSNGQEWNSLSTLLGYVADPSPNFSVLAGFSTGVGNTGPGLLAMGPGAANDNSGENVIALGAYSGGGMGAGNSDSSLTAVGFEAVANNTTGSSSTGFGYTALYSNTIGDANNAFGLASLGNNVSGSYNSAFGHQSLTNNDVGQQNSAFGYQTLGQNTSAVSNSAFGYQALGHVSTSSNNSAFGKWALLNCTGTENAAFGCDAGQSIVGGNYNTLLGSEVGTAYTGSESSNIQLGYGVAGTLGESNVLRVGSGTGTGSGQINQAFISGIRGITTGQNNAVAVLVDSNGQLGTVSSSAKYKENITDVSDDVSDKLSELRLRSFNYKSDSNTSHVGLIAEEVAEVMPSLVASDGNGEPFSVKYHELPILLLAEVQKLKREIAELKRHGQF